MARRRRAKNSNDTLKYFLIGAAALVVLFLVFNVGPIGKYTDVPTVCDWTPSDETWTPENWGAETWTPENWGAETWTPALYAWELEIWTSAGNTWDTTYSCSDTQYTDYTTCDSAGSCSDGSSADQTTCETADETWASAGNTWDTTYSCSDSQYTDQTTCESAESCSDGSSADQTTCESAGSCSDGSSADQTTCASAGSCSDETITDQSSCESAESCSDGSSADQTTCESAGSCSDGTITDQLSCEAEGSCSDGSYGDQTTCEASELCTTQELEDADGDGIDDTEDLVWDLTRSGLTTDSEEVEVSSYLLENDGTFSMNLQSTASLSASCSDNSNRAQAACEVDQHHWTEAATEACTEIATGTDVTVTYADSTSCLEPGVCSDETITDQSICESAYSCSDSSYSTQITCESADELWGNFWSWILTNTWTSESDAACSDGTSTDQAACEAASVNTWSEASDVLNDLQSATVLVKVEYYDLETNEILSSTIYTSQISIGETSAEAFSISVPQTSTAVSYIATVNVWSGMIGTSDWQPYSEKIELRGEFHP